MKFFILFFIAIAAISAYFGYHNTEQGYETISPIQSTPQVTVQNTPPSAPTALPSPTLVKNLITLKSTIDDSLRNTSSTYGIYVKNLKTGESYGVNEDRKFEPASLYKLWVMAKTYELVQSGALKESDVLSQNIVTLNELFQIPQESAELTDGSITLSVTDAITRMITVSDNYSALLLSEKLTNSAIQRYLVEHGFINSTLGDPPQTTPLEIFHFLDELYKETLTNHEYSQKMLTHLKNQKLNGKIPKYIPGSITIAHKTGELGYFSHDAGIVYGTKGDYLIVAMSEGDNPEGSDERISLLAKAVYDYFENH